MRTVEISERNSSILSFFVFTGDL